MLSPVWFVPVSTRRLRLRWPGVVCCPSGLPGSARPRRLLRLAVAASRSGRPVRRTRRAAAPRTVVRPCRRHAWARCSACSRSPMRSSTCSMPTDSRNRSAGAGVPAPSTLARLLDQALGAAQRGGAFPQRHVRRRGDRGRLAAAPAAVHADRQHAAVAAAHLRPGDGVPLAARQARVQHLGHQRMPHEVLGDALCRRTGRTHAQVQRAHAAQQQPGFERASVPPSCARTLRTRCQ